MTGKRVKIIKREAVDQFLSDGLRWPKNRRVSTVASCLHYIIGGINVSTVYNVPLKI